MTSDLNRNITDVDYNVLNLTQKVSQASGDIYYVYTATGRKLSKHSAVETRNYISGLEFTTKIAGLLPEFIATEEGRLLVDNATTYTYEYTIADHLGNARVTFKVNALYQPILGNHYKVFNYYPFGLVMEGDGMASAANNTEPHNNYQYNGKELQTETGWNDFGARMYDASIGRWMVVDPLAEQFLSSSPNNYAMNNPLRFVDPKGMAPEDFIVLSQRGRELRRIKMEGEDVYVKVNEAAFNQASSRFDYNSEDYNTMLSVWSLRNQERTTRKTNLVSEQIGVGLNITGSIRDNNNLIGDVSVSFQVLFDNGSTHALGSYDGVAGGFGNGAPENGAYTVNNYHDRGPDSDWYNEAMTSDGVGFSYHLNPQFSTGRTLLRIHPDGNKEGTLGCIGLSGNAQELTDFRNTLNRYLNNGRTSLSVNINIRNNPNNNGRKVKRISNVNE